MSTDPVSTALAPVSSLVSFFSSGVDLASKVYEFSLAIRAAETVDKVGIHIGPVIRHSAPAGEWTQKLLFVFHRAVGGDTVKHHYNIDMKITGNSKNDPQEKWSENLEQIQAKIMEQLDAESVKQVFDNIKAQTKRTAAALAVPFHAKSEANGNAAAAAADDSGNGNSSSGPSDVLSAAVAAINNLATLEKSFDSKRTVVLSRIGYVVDSMLGAKVPEENHWYKLGKEVEDYCIKVKNFFVNALYGLATVTHELRTPDSERTYIDLVLNIRIGHEATLSTATPKEEHKA